MKNFIFLLRNALFVFAIIFSFQRCTNPNFGGSKNGNDSTQTAENNMESEEEYENEEPMKEVDWSDGNTYSYDFTETITTTDSLGNKQEITIYMNNKPSDGEINCDTKTCKWCGKEVYANNYSIEEYPNINWLRGKPDLTSLFSAFGSIFDGTHYYDLDNNRIRTEWQINCDYPGPSGFCSLKCQNEYKYR